MNLFIAHVLTQRKHVSSDGKLKVSGIETAHQHIHIDIAQPPVCNTRNHCMGDTITYNQHSTNIEGMNDTSCPSNSNSSSKSIDKFELAWCDFYDKVNSWASPSSASSNTSDSSECDVVVENSKIKEDGLKWLGTINKLLFGQIEDRKSYATNYGIGVLELILKVYEKCVVNTESTNDEELLLSTLKALKSCVVKNASGRRRCRRAQVMAFLENMLKECNSQKIVEEAFTLLSALSMNDDLNTWQVKVIILYFSRHSISQTITFKGIRRIEYLHSIIIIDIQLVSNDSAIVNIPPITIQNNPYIPSSSTPQILFKPSTS